MWKKIHKRDILEFRNIEQVSLKNLIQNIIKTVLYKNQETFLPFHRGELKKQIFTVWSKKRLPEICLGTKQNSVPLLLSRYQRKTRRNLLLQVQRPRVRSLFRKKILSHGERVRTFIPSRAEKFDPL